MSLKRPSLWWRLFVGIILVAVGVGWLYLSAWLASGASP